VLFLVHIDLTGADLAAFERYEMEVLPLLPAHGGVLEQRLRSLDNAHEIHLLRFETEAGRQAYLADPHRADQAGLWRQSGATATTIQVEAIG